MLGGLLRQRVGILHPTAVSNGAGGRTQTWATVGYVPGRVYVSISRGGDGNEEEVGGKPVVAEMADAMLDLQLVSLSSEDRISYNGRTYEVLTVDRQGTVTHVVGRAV